MEQNTLEINGMERNGVEQNGTKQNTLERNGTKPNRMPHIVLEFASFFIVHYYIITMLRLATHFFSCFSFC